MDNTKKEKSEIRTPKSEIERLLKAHPGGFSVDPAGIVTPDREALEITSIEQFSKIAREPRTVALDLYGGRVVKFKIRPLDVNQQREIDALDSEAPLPPLKKQVSTSPSIARGVKTEKGPEEYDWSDKEYQKKAHRHRQLKQAAIISQGLLNLTIPGKNLEEKAEFLAANFTPRILDGIQASIYELTSQPIERAVFTSGAG